MRFDLYQAETACIAAREASVLEAARLLMQQRELNALEENGVLHALQVLIENAIGKAKQIIKNKGQPVPISAYDAFAALVDCRVLGSSELKQWNAIIGLRNRVVHDYMNIDMDEVLHLVREKKELFIINFLLLRV